MTYLYLFLIVGILCGVLLMAYGAYKLARTRGDQYHELMHQPPGACR